MFSSGCHSFWSNDLYHAAFGGSFGVILLGAMRDNELTDFAFQALSAFFLALSGLVDAVLAFEERMVEIFARKNGADDSLKKAGKPDC